MKTGSLLSEEVLRLLSETRGLTAAELARKASANIAEVEKITQALVAAGLVKAKDDLLMIDPALREIVLSRESFLPERG